MGPTRGSDRLWYYDTLDIATWLHSGENTITVEVIRFFPSANAGISFARTSAPGLVVSGSIGDEDISTGATDTKWEGREDDNVHYPSKSDKDIFLHVSNSPGVMVADRRYTKRRLGSSL